MQQISKFEQVKENASLEAYVEDTLQRVPGGFVCPNCGSGLGNNRTPAFSLTPKSNPTKWKCFSCGCGGDIFDLAGCVHKTDNKLAQLDYVADWANVVFNEPPIHSTSSPLSGNSQTQKSISENQRREHTYINTCQQNVSSQEAHQYLVSRGFTDDEISHFGFGYDPQKCRIIIPWGTPDYYHIDRDLTSKSKFKYLKPKVDEVGEQPVFHPEVLSESIYFLVEGIFDALSINALGYKASAFMGTSNYSMVEHIKIESKNSIVIILLDSDEKGRSAQAKLVNELTFANIRTLDAHVPLPYKDANEFFKTDRTSFGAFLNELEVKAKQLLKNDSKDTYNATLERLGVFSATSIAENLLKGVYKEDAISTGFATLDKTLHGGLTPNLYVLGALSSLGKTTFALQIADAIAVLGVPVLFASLEMSASKLVAKSMSRLIYQNNHHVIQNDLNLLIATHDACLLTAHDTYTHRIAPNLHFLDATPRPTVEEIRRIAEYIGASMGLPPVIFVDYLQAITAKNDRDTDKRIVDINVGALYQLAHDLKTPVFAISSLNRSSYMGEITMEAFKDSGSIEYDADILLGLQPKGITELVDVTKESRLKRKLAHFMRDYRGKDIRDCEITVLKNRGYATPTAGVPLRFIPAAATFVETGETRTITTYETPSSLCEYNTHKRL